MSTQVLSPPLGDTVRAMDFSPSKLELTPPQQQAAPTDEEAESIALALRLQEEDNAYAQSWGGGVWTAPSPGQESQEQMSAEDEESLALAIRLQQEDDDAQLRATLGLADGEEVPGSPTSFSYEQLLRLGDTVGVVSRGASSESVEALKRMTVAEARNDSNVLLGEQVRHSLSLNLFRRPLRRLLHARPTTWRVRAEWLVMRARANNPSRSTHPRTSPPSARSAAWSMRTTTSCSFCRASTASTPSAWISG